LPGPGAKASERFAKIESTLEASVIPAAPMAVIFKKFLRLVDFFCPTIQPFLVGYSIKQINYLMLIG
jgi:hypothetical protein